MTRPRTRTAPDPPAAPPRSLPHQRAPAARLPAWWALAALVAAGLIVYANSFAGALFFDDLGTIVRNPQIRTLSHLGPLLVPPAETAVAGRPLVHLSFALNYAWQGVHVWGYHAINLALHLACGMLIFALINTALWNRANGRGMAFAVSLLWIVHPLNSEVVDYITQRTESMMALCFLLVLYAAARNWRIAAVAACAAGLLCKETIVVAPLAVLLYDWAFADEGSFTELWRRRWTFYAALCATWLLPAAMLATRGQTFSAGFATAHVGAWTYLLNQPAMILRYLRLAVWPSDLVLYYGWPRALTFADVWLPVVAVVLLLAASLVALVKWRRAGAMAVWVFLVLAPTSSVIPIATEVGAERRMYLPLIGVLVLFVCGLMWVARWAAGARWSSSQARALPAAAVAIAAVALGATTYARNAEYGSALQMASTVAERWPTANAHQMLGSELLVAGRADDALPHLRIAVAEYPPARYFLGQALFGTRQYQDAIVELERFTREEPTLAPTATRLLIGKAYGALGQMPQALEQFKRVLAAEPGNAEAHGFAAEALMAQRAYADAVPHYHAFLAANPRNGAAWTSLGMALVSLQQLAEAIPAFRNAADVEPRNSRFRQNLARVLLEQGDVAGALRDAQEAISINDRDAAAYDVLGRVLVHSGRIADARSAFEHAVAIDPGYVPAVTALKQLNGR